MKNFKHLEEASSTSNVTFIPFFCFMFAFPGLGLTQIRILNTDKYYLRLSPCRRGQELEIFDAGFGSCAESPSPCPSFELAYFGILLTIQRL